MFVWDSARNTTAAVLVALAPALVLLGAMPVQATEYTTLTVAVPTSGSLQIRTVTVPSDAVTTVRAAYEAKGGHVGRTSKVWALGDPLEERQWGYQRLGGSSIAPYGAETDGLTVAVVDTGVDARHPDFGQRVLPGYDFVANQPMAVPYDDNGHGTHVAGVIAAVSGNSEGIAGLTSARILPVKVLDETGYGDDALVGRGIVWAVDQGADIVNLSLGTYDDNPALRASIEYAESEGVAVVAAAGNDGANGPTMYPAAYPQALAVAATTPTDTRAVFSTAGSYVDVAAPGQGIISTFPGGRYVTMSGTSMAAPHAAGSLALVAQSRDVSVRDAVELVLSTAIDLGASGVDREYGRGLVNLPVAMGVGPEVPWEAPEPSMSLPPLPSLTPAPLPSFSPTQPPTPSLTPQPLPTPTLTPLPPQPAPSVPTGPPGPTSGPLPSPTLAPPSAAPPSVRPGPAILAVAIPLPGDQGVRLVIRVPSAEAGERVSIRSLSGGARFRKTVNLDSFGAATVTLPASVTSVRVRHQDMARVVSVSTR